MHAEVDEIEHCIPWVVEPSHSGSVHTVAELLPGGHEMYLRLFHPFVPWSAEPHRGAVSTRIRWATLAAQAGVPFSATITWRQLKPLLPDNGEGRPWAVWDSDLEEQTAHDLYSTLEGAAPEPCYFEFGLIAIIGTDDHEPRLYRAASVAGRHESVQRIRGRGAMVTTPSLSWDHHQRWIVNCDYDLSSTYVATDTATATRLLAHPDLEILEVSQSTRIDNRADEQTA